jgi:Holliday junction resolvase RusA-like endonuclease
MEVDFVLPRRRADFRYRGGVLVLAREHQMYPGTKDVDNMLKFCMDAMHDVLFDDDKCVVRVTAEKSFLDEGENEAFTKIRIYKNI